MTVSGTRMLRKEDPELLSGEARYVDDLAITGALWLGIVRSPFAHARIGSIDSTEAAAMPGVVAVYTGTQLVELGMGPLPCAWAVTEDMVAPEHLPVAVSEACFVGDAVAVVVAESRYAACDAVGAVLVDYDPLPVVVDLEDAASDETLAWTGGELKARGVDYLLGVHCTGVEATYRLRSLLGLSRSAAATGAVGSSFTLGAGIDPLALAR